MILEKHRPCPGVVIDGGWVVRDATTEVIVTVAGAAQVNLDELRVELVYPVNEDCVAFVRSLDPGPQ